MDINLLLENMAKYAAAKGTSLSGVSKQAGLSKNYASAVKNGNSPKLVHVFAIAQVLGVSVSDLIGDARQPEEAPELLACWAELNEEGREALLHVAQGFVYSGIYKNGDPDAVDQDA